MEDVGRRPSVSRFIKRLLSSKDGRKGESVGRLEREHFQQVAFRPISKFEVNEHQVCVVKVVHCYFLWMKHDSMNGVAQGELRGPCWPGSSSIIKTCAR